MTNTPEKSSVVFYHEKCPDGFAAAAVAFRVLGNSAEYIPCAYYKKPAFDVRGKDVYILDFSFSADILDEMGKEAKSLVLLDHHESAQKTLSRYKPLCCGRIHFDMKHCGAMLAWHHFYPGEPAPFMLKAVESRDLWRWNVPGDKEFLAWLDIQPMELELWASLMDQVPDDAQERGAAYMEKERRIVLDIAELALPVRIDGVQGMMVQCPPTLASDVGALLARKCGTFALVWRTLPDQRVKCSLRSVDGFNALEIAERFGGGGHKNACSFNIPRERLFELLDGSITSAAEVVGNR